MRKYIIRTIIIISIYLSFVIVSGYIHVIQKMEDRENIVWISNFGETVELNKQDIKKIPTYRSFSDPDKLIPLQTLKFKVLDADDKWKIVTLVVTDATLISDEKNKESVAIRLAGSLSNIEQKEQSKISSYINDIRSFIF